LRGRAGSEVWRYLIPDLIAQRVEDIDAGVLTAWGVRGIVLDLDNTIVPWNTPDVAPSVARWIRTMRDAGLRICLLTNNYTRRATGVAGLLDIPIIKAALKPSPLAFFGALRMLGVPAAEAAVIGDQIYTDVLGGKLLGMRAVLVNPLSSREFPTTKIVRWLERPVRSRLLRGA
jgi:HAD superfamily phosphatase (TIGR01668 family)